ncbi:hypothetical protein BX616_007947, partial [Lobosporangium transversale]
SATTIKTTPVATLQTRWCLQKDLNSMISSQKRRLTTSTPTHNSKQNSTGTNNNRTPLQRMSRTEDHVSQLKITRLNSPKAGDTVPSTATATSSSSSSSTSASSSISFNRRLEFLSGGRTVAPRSRSYPISSEAAIPITKVSKTQSAKNGVLKKYKPGFMAGDFICPQCGSHNFRPPEYSPIRHALQRKQFRQQLNEESASSTVSSTVPSTAPLDNLGDNVVQDASSKAQAKKEEEKQDPLRQSQHHDYHHRLDTQPQPQPLKTRAQSPLGAKAHCFECGFETSYNLPMAAANDDKSSYSTNDSPSSSSSFKRPKTLTEQTIHLRNDIRLAKPRDYVCPQCLTVNFYNRLNCIGCGTFAPWIREKVEAG